MISHLSSDQISRLMIGEATPQEAQHAVECAQCAEEVTRMRETLSMFRDSAQHWSERSGGSIAPNRAFLQAASPAFDVSPFRWALAMAVLILVVMVPVYKSISDRHRAADAEDALLLEQVNAHLSRNVAAPMEPLMELLSEGSADEIGGRQ